MAGTDVGIVHWVDNPDAAHEIFSDLLNRTWPVGLDTEFYGCDITTESPVGRSVCHVFSVAAPTGPLLPRGHHGACSWVLPGSLLTHPTVRAWLESPAHVKPVHNQPADAHTIRNHGVRLRGGVNTLELARFVYPARATGTRRGFSLDALGTDLVGTGKTEDFDDLLGYDAEELRAVWRKKKRCECGALSCLKRSEGHKEKTEELVEVVTPFKVRRHIHLPDLTPEHPLWNRYLNYAAWDAVLALAIYEVMMREAQRERPYPWVLF